MYKPSRDIRSREDMSPDPRYIFNGDGHPLPSDVMVRKNKPGNKKRQSPLKTIVAIFLLTALGVFTIKNIVTIDQLAQDINDKRLRYSAIKNTNELLKAEINRKSGMERIIPIAQKDLGMMLPKEQPIWLNHGKEKK